MNRRPDARLLLDEMFSPAIAAELRDRGHDVIAVADRPDLRAKSDEEIFAWASAGQRWLLTENVKDFRPIMLRALPGGFALQRAGSRCSIRVWFMRSLAAKIRTAARPS